MIKLHFYKYKNKYLKPEDEIFYIELKINNLTIGIIKISKLKDDHYQFEFIDCKMMEADEHVNEIEEYELFFDEKLIKWLKEFNNSLKKTIKQLMVGRTEEYELRDPFLDNNLKILMSEELDKILES